MQAAPRDPGVGGSEKAPAPIVLSRTRHPCAQMYGCDCGQPCKIMYGCVHACRKGYAEGGLFWNASCASVCALSCAKRA
eukprot:4440521-Prymnesium_polylepis.1